ncbi:DUF1652 domain-containing protein [Pseudomonas sp.]|uniref:DUF1652 domain-containing protein n=1 Tax=Pseudomonas sp. TaxID=306 RepID=UPI0028AA3A85|nr:DUF1652 domain-containing protein [Pseudomonas sp.]
MTVNTYQAAEEAVKTLEKSFAPLRCVAEVWDYGERIRFRIFDGDDEPLLTVEEIVRKRFSQPAELQAVISTARARLRELGNVLDERSD